MKPFDLLLFPRAMAAVMPVLSLMSAQALAQNASPAATLPTVTVHGASSPLLPPTSAVPGPELVGQRAATSDTARLLSDLPGVSLRGAGGVSSR